MTVKTAAEADSRGEKARHGARCMENASRRREAQRHRPVIRYPHTGNVARPSNRALIRCGLPAPDALGIGLLGELALTGWSRTPLPARWVRRDVAGALFRVTPPSFVGIPGRARITLKSLNTMTADLEI